MKPAYLLFCLIIFCTACSKPATIPTAITCNGYPVSATALPYCQIIPSGVLIQTALNQQAQFSLPMGQFTLKGTVIIWTGDVMNHIIQLEGTSVLALDEHYHSLDTGDDLTISQDNSGYIIAEPLAYNYAQLSNLPLEPLPRPISLIVPTETPPPAPNLVEGCLAPDDWTDRYTIQRGDTLTNLASTFNITLSELQNGNCIKNANQIQVGDIIFAPFGSVKPTQPALTYTPSAVDFRLDKNTINAGECTILRWDVRNVFAIYREDDLVGEQGSQEVCPADTSTYHLKVQYFDDSETQHEITLTVTKS